ncbi:MAG: hypothetical protein ACMXYK_00420 [Candidatus Woesearchaeota archaeon]
MASFTSKILFCSMMVLVLLLSSCMNQGADSIRNYRTGMVEPTITFMRDMPPAEIPTNTNMQIGIEVHNRGGYDIQNGYLSINFDGDYFNANQRSSTVNLEGRNQFNPQGESRPFFFQGTTLDLEAQSLSKTIPVIASFCYPYTTVLEDNVCIDFSFDTGREQGRPVCTPSDLRYSGQGAPVGVRSIGYTVGDDNGEVTLYFSFEVQSRGLVVRPENFRAPCTSAQSTGLNRALFSASLSDHPLNCVDEINLRDGSATVRCETTHRIESQWLPYEAPLRVEISYGHMVSKSTSFEIKAR